MKRRHWLAAVAGTSVLAAAASRAAAQPKPGRVGVLIAGDPEPSWTLFRKGMAEQGLAEASGIHYEYRNAAPSDAGRLAEHAASLVQAKVDVLVAVLTPAILAAQKATSTIPTVFWGSDINSGIVKNLARPEGNLTGLFGTTPIVASKGLQILREIKPAAKSVGVLLNIPDPFHVIQRRVYAEAGRAQQFEIVETPIDKPADLGPAIERLAARGVDAVMVQPSLPLREVAALALKHRLPAITSRREFTEAGGLLSYGADQPHDFRQIAGYVARLLKGAKVGDLPAQLPSRFELVVNQKTARQIGVTFSPMFLGRADEVLE